MDDLLPYYERELAYLRRYSREFAQRYPKIAGRLGITGEHAEDPNAEHIIQSFALLSARFNKRLDDDYAEFTDSMLEVMYPHYLRPFPSCSIAQISPKQDLEDLSKPVVVERGTEMASHEVRGVKCTFRTAYDVTLAPVRIREARFIPVAMAPSATALPPNATGVVSITFESTASQLTVADLKLDNLRTYLSGDQALVAALSDCLSLRTLAAYVEPERNGRWLRLSEVPIQPVGFDDADALIDYPARAHSAYRLLTEYFAFPEKFNFVDFDLAAMAQGAGPCQRLTLHIVLQDVRADSDLAKMLDTLASHHFRLFCTPVVNLFKTPADPVRLTHQSTAYPVVVAGRYAYGYEVYSIDSVRLVRKQGGLEEVIELRPFYSLRHGEQSNVGHYWFARRNETVAQISPGYETELSIVDLDFNPSRPVADTLSIEMTSTNRDLPPLLSIGQDAGDLFLPGGNVAGRVTLLMRPTQTTRFSRRQAAHWRLISHLSLNHVSLTKDGAAALKEMLRLYDQRHTAISARHIDGIVVVEQRDALQWMQGKPFATFVRGLEIRITIDEDHFAGASLGTFINVIDRFFGLYVHINSFTQLVVISKRTGQEIIRLKPRSGDAILV